MAGDHILGIHVDGVQTLCEPSGEIPWAFTTHTLFGKFGASLHNLDDAGFKFSEQLRFFAGEFPQ